MSGNKKTLSQTHFSLASSSDSEDDVESVISVEQSRIDALADSVEIEMSVVTETMEGSADTEESIEGSADTEETIEGPADTEETIEGPADTEETIEGSADTEETIEGPADTEETIEGPADTGDKAESLPNDEQSSLSKWSSDSEDDTETLPNEQLDSTMDENVEHIEGPADTEENREGPADPEENREGPADPEETIEVSADPVETIEGPADTEEIIEVSADPVETIEGPADTGDKAESVPNGEQSSLSKWSSDSEDDTETLPNEQLDSTMDENLEHIEGPADIEETIELSADPGETIEGPADTEETIEGPAETGDKAESLPNGEQSSLFEWSDSENNIEILPNEQLDSTIDENIEHIEGPVDTEETIEGPADTEESIEGPAETGDKAESVPNGEQSSLFEWSDSEDVTEILPNEQLDSNVDENVGIEEHIEDPAITGDKAESSSSDEPSSLSEWSSDSEDETETLPNEQLHSTMDESVEHIECPADTEENREGSADTEEEAELMPGEQSDSSDDFSDTAENKESSTDSEDTESLLSLMNKCLIDYKSSYSKLKVKYNTLKEAHIDMERDFTLLLELEKNKTEQLSQEVVNINDNFERLFSLNTAVKQQLYEGMQSQITKNNDLQKENNSLEDSFREIEATYEAEKQRLNDKLQSEITKNRDLQKEKDRLEHSFREFEAEKQRLNDKLQSEITKNRYLQKEDDSLGHSFREIEAAYESEKHRLNDKLQSEITKNRDLQKENDSLEDSFREIEAAYEAEKHRLKDKLQSEITKNRDLQQKLDRLKDSNSGLEAEHASVSHVDMCKLQSENSEEVEQPTQRQRSLKQLRHFLGLRKPKRWKKNPDEQSWSVGECASNAANVDTSVDSEDTEPSLGLKNRCLKDQKTHNVNHNKEDKTCCSAVKQQLNDKLQSEVTKNKVLQKEHDRLKDAFRETEAKHEMLKAGYGNLRHLLVDTLPSLITESKDLLEELDRINDPLIHPEAEHASTSHVAHDANIQLQSKTNGEVEQSAQRHPSLFKRLRHLLGLRMPKRWKKSSNPGTHKTINIHSYSSHIHINM
ncbi:uncharacterized protein V6R79_020034 [Siganus canaliculatus]